MRTMNKILSFVAIVCAVAHVVSGGAGSGKPVEVALSILSGTTTNTTVSADFKCHPSGALNAKDITGKFNLTQTFIPCTGLKSLVQRYVFNMTSSGGKRQILTVRDLKTVSLYVNGEQIATQSGPIEGPVCKGGKVILTHWFRSREPMSCSSPKGLTHIESPSSTFRITGASCEVFCTGRFVLDYRPGIKNSRMPGILAPAKPVKPITIRPFKPVINTLTLG